MFPNFPWTNFHRLNADWILKTVQTAVDTVNNAVERIEAALSTVDGLTTRVTALETATQQLQASVDGLDTRVNGAFRRIETLEADMQNVDTRVNGAFRRIETIEQSKANKPIIINLSADGFPAQVPTDAQTQVQAALFALQNGSGAAQVHIEQQVDQELPAVFNLQLNYAGDGILTGIQSKTVFNSTTQEYGMRITAVSINTNTMLWEMGSQNLPQIST